MRASHEPLPKSCHNDGKIAKKILVNLKQRGSEELFMTVSQFTGLIRNFVRSDELKIVECNSVCFCPTP